MSQDSPRRRSAPAVVWLLLGGVLVLVLSCAALGLLVWLQNEQVQVLSAELANTEARRQESEARLADLQGKVAVLEDRLAALEGSDLDRQLASLRAATEAATSPDEVARLQASLTEIQARLGNNQAVWDDLAERVSMLESAGEGTASDPSSELRLSVARQRQSHNLSCESSAASMAAQYHGVALSEADVLASLPSDENPNLGFRGNVDGPTGGIEDYGVYSGPILDILNGAGLQARPTDGGLDGIRSALDRGNPVIAWVTYDCQPSTPTKHLIGGQEVTLVPLQHVVVVTGYSPAGVWANDPWDGQEDFYTTSDFERALGYFGGMAIEVGSP